MSSSEKYGLMADRGRIGGMSVNALLLVILAVLLLLVMGRYWIFGDMDRRLAEAGEAQQSAVAEQMSAQVQPLMGSLDSIKQDSAAAGAAVEAKLAGLQADLGQAQAQIAAMGGQLQSARGELLSLRGELESLRAGAMMVATAVPSTPHDQKAYAALAAAGMNGGGGTVEAGIGGDAPPFLPTVAGYRPHSQALYETLSAAGVNWRAAYQAPEGPLVREVVAQPASSTSADNAAPATDVVVAAAAEAAVAVAEPAAADPAAGEKLFKRCASCHGVDEGGKHKTGPNLWGVVGHDKGGAEGFKYSNAFQALEGAWDEASLDGFLTDPKGYVPGTKMNFKGLSDAGDRANLIAYLATLK